MLLFYIVIYIQYINMYMYHTYYIYIYIYIVHSNYYTYLNIWHICIYMYIHIYVYTCCTYNTYIIFIRLTVDKVGVSTKILPRKYFGKVVVRSLYTLWQQLLDNRNINNIYLIVILFKV